MLDSSIPTSCNTGLQLGWGTLEKVPVVSWWSKHLKTVMNHVAEPACDSLSTPNGVVGRATFLCTNTYSYVRASLAEILMFYVGR